MFTGDSARWPAGVFAASPESPVTGTGHTVHSRHCPQWTLWTPCNLLQKLSVTPSLGQDSWLTQASARLSPALVTATGAGRGQPAAGGQGGKGQISIFIEL